MKTLESIVRRLFFYGAFVLVALAVFEKFANILGYTLFRGVLVPSRLLEFAAIGLLFAIAMQLHQIRMSLTTKPPEPPK